MLHGIPTVPSLGSEPDPLGRSSMQIIDATNRKNAFSDGSGLALFI
jgi:hypothetical protein